MFRKSFIWNSITILSRHCAGIVCTERRRKHGTICTDTKKPEKDQTRNNRARMAIKAGDPGKRPWNIPADARGVQVRLEWIAEHAKRNYHLGRFFPAFFPCAGALCLVPQAFICRFKAFRLPNGQKYGASRKNAIQGKIQAQAAQKNHWHWQLYISVLCFRRLQGCKGLLKALWTTPTYKSRSFLLQPLLRWLR